MNTEKCFACERSLKTQNYKTVTTCDGQRVYVGTDCYRHILLKGKIGYQPPLGGPKLYILE